MGICPDSCDTTSCDHQQLVVVLFIQQHRLHVVKDCLRSPFLTSTSGRSHSTAARCPRSLGSFCVWTPCFQSFPLHTLCGFICSPTFEVKGSRWVNPRDKQEMGVTGATHTSVNSQLLLPRLEMVLTGGKISSCGVKLGSFWG